MPITINSKILLSAASIAAAAALIIGATFAFFSDEETSTGNTFVAGELDLQVDSECHYFQNDVDVGCGEGAAFGNWELSDLVPGVHKFFNFNDIKPGDRGEDTVSLHVFDNDAWGRLVISNVVDAENGCTESELVAEPGCGSDGDGELRENLLFQVWLDQGSTLGFQGQSDPGEGDNVLQPGDEPVLITEGTIDSGGETHNVWEGLAAAYVLNGCSGDGSAQSDCPGLAQDGHMVGSITYYFGLGWRLPDTVGNDVQSDGLGADMTIEVEQYRNNPSPFI